MRGRYSVALVSSFGLHALFVLALIYTWHTKDLPEELPVIPVAVIADYKGEPFPNPTTENNAENNAQSSDSNAAASVAAPPAPSPEPEQSEASEQSPISRIIEKIETKIQPVPPKPVPPKPTPPKPIEKSVAKPEPTIDPKAMPQKQVVQQQKQPQKQVQQQIQAKPQVQPKLQQQAQTQQRTAAPNTKPATQTAPKPSAPATPAASKSNGSLSSQFDLSAAMKSSSGVNANGRNAPALGSSTSKAGNGGGELATDLQAKLRSQLKNCWAIPADLSNSASLIVSVQIELKADGHLARVKLISPNKVGATTQQQIAIDNALTAVRNCDPYDLPVGRYEEWKSFTFRFNPKQAR